MIDSERRRSHVTLTDRSTAMIAFKVLKENGFPDCFGSKTSIDLVQDVKHEEIEDASRSYE